MIRLWKRLRTNMMYWRFRYVTRNRLRMRQWWSRHKPARRPARPVYSGARGRGTAAFVYHGSARRSWTAMAALVILLTALTYLVGKTYVNPGLVYLAGTIVVVGSIYYALRGA
jgi:hypothetical protein